MADNQLVHLQLLLRQAASAALTTAMLFGLQGPITSASRVDAAADS